MKFSHREWVTDAVTGAITGAIGGAVMAMFVPDPPFALASSYAGIVGLVVGMATHPIKWLLERRPGGKS